MLVDLRTWYLELLEPSQFRAAFSSNSNLTVVRAEIPCPELNRFLYTSVGGDWYWIDRLSWSYERWLKYLDRPELQTWVAYLSGTPAGYVELEAQSGNNVEIVYFGLLRQFIGQGIGRHLLSVGVQKAWAMEAQRVWVHTGSLDGDHALANYQARGFQLYKQKIHQEELLEKPIEPWVMPI